MTVFESHYLIYSYVYLAESDLVEQPRRAGTTASLSPKAWPLACTPMNIMAGFTILLIQERLVTVYWHQPWYSGKM